MRRLFWHNSFRRAFKRAVRKDPEVQDRIFAVIELLQTDPFNPQLRTHRLHGRLAHLCACWVEYDCRVIFSLEPVPGEQDAVVLIDIGSHDDVY